MEREILIVWYILEQIASEKGVPESDTEELSIHISTFLESGFLAGDRIMTVEYLRILLVKGILEKVEIEIKEIAENKGKVGNKKHLVKTKRRLLTKCWEKNSKIACYQGIIIFHLDVNYPKLVQHLSSLMEKWVENSYCVYKKMVRSDIQIREIVKEIYALLPTYPANKLYINLKERKEIDICGTILYLENIGALFILEFFREIEHGEDPGIPYFIVRLLPKFYEDFKLGQDGTIQFDFENLMPIKERKKRIYYKSPTELERDGIIYEMKKNTFPFFLFSLLQQSKEKKVTFEDIEKAFGGAGKQIGRNMPKDLRNLRGGLKKRFEIEGEENLLFVLEGNTISLQKEMFAF